MVRRKPNMKYKCTFKLSIILSIALILSISCSRDNYAELLEKELIFQSQNLLMEIDQGNSIHYVAPSLSSYAKDLAEKISVSTDQYSPIIKAVALEQFDQARELLQKIDTTDTNELSRLYSTHALVEFYARSYPVSAGWYMRAISLDNSNPSLLNRASVSIFFAGEHETALMVAHRSAAIADSIYDLKHPQFALGIERSAELTHLSGQFENAERLYQQALKSCKEAF